MLQRFNVAARKILGKSPVRTDFLKTSRVPEVLQFKSWSTGQIERHETNVPILGIKNDAGTWDVKINIVVYDSQMNENVIDHYLLEGVSLEEAVDYMLEKEKRYADTKNAGDFAAYVAKRGPKEDERHITNAAWRLDRAGIELNALKPPQPKTPHKPSAGRIATLRKQGTQFHTSRDLKMII